MEGDVEALPLNQISVSNIEMWVDFSIECGFMVDWGLFVLGARWFAACPSASPAFVCCRVPFLWSCPPLCRGSGPGTRFQPCLWFIREWNDALDLKGPCDAFGALAAASVYMYGKLGASLRQHKHCLLRLSSQWLWSVTSFFLVGAFRRPCCIGGWNGSSFYRLLLPDAWYPAATSILALALSVTLVGEFRCVLVGIFEFCWFNGCPLCTFCVLSTYLEVDPQRKGKFLMHSFSPHL